MPSSSKKPEKDCRPRWDHPLTHQVGFGDGKDLTNISIRVPDTFRDSLAKNPFQLPFIGRAEAMAVTEILPDAGVCCGRRYRHVIATSTAHRLETNLKTLNEFVVGDPGGSIPNIIEDVLVEPMALLGVHMTTYPETGGHTTYHFDLSGLTLAFRMKEISRYQ
jgi:hypothetical protein